MFFSTVWLGDLERIRNSPQNKQYTHSTIDAGLENIFELFFYRNLRSESSALSFLVALVQRSATPANYVKFPSAVWFFTFSQPDLNSQNSSRVIPFHARLARRSWSQKGTYKPSFSTKMTEGGNLSIFKYKLTMNDLTITYCRNSINWSTQPPAESTLLKREWMILFDSFCFAF